MAVTSTPVSGRLRIAYANDLSDMRIGAITPWAEANNVALLADAIRSIQAAAANVEDIYFTVENLLEVE